MVQDLCSVVRMRRVGMMGWGGQERSSSGAIRPRRLDDASSLPRCLKRLTPAVAGDLGLKDQDLGFRVRPPTRTAPGKDSAPRATHPAGNHERVIRWLCERRYSPPHAFPDRGFVFPEQWTKLRLPNEAKLLCAPGDPRDPPHLTLFAAAPAPSPCSPASPPPC
jgi:hypothetical protein